MKKAVAAVVLILSLSFVFATCGGGGGGTQPPPLISKVTGVSVSPTTVTLGPGETKQFTAAVTGTGTYSTAVTWSVSPSVGTISATGLYTAPTTASASVTVTATSTSDTTKSGSATVNFSAAVTGVVVSPATVSIAPGEAKQFTATVNGTGAYTNGVTWAVNNVAGGNATVGTISATGLYTAPATGSGSVTVTATSTFDTTKSGNATLTYAPPTVTSVVVAPGTVTLTAGSTKQFTATVSGTGNYDQTVTWSVNNVAGGNATVGTISAAGLFTAANPSPDSVTIKATSTFDTTKSGSTTITFSGVGRVTVSPVMTTVAPGDSKQFSASVTGNGTYGTGVTWYVNNVAGGNATVGTISATGLYKTPYPAPASVTVKATSTSDTTKFGTAAVALQAPTLAAGPALSIDAGVETHAINPLVYGMNNWGMDPAGAKLARDTARVTVDRWGGNGTTRYNYKLDVSNAGADWYFEVNPNTKTEYYNDSDFNRQVRADTLSGAKTIGTVPVIGWTVKARQTMCSFPVSKYGPQQKTDPYQNPPNCGNGVKLDGTNITNNDPTDTCMKIDETWAGDWVKALKGWFGTAAQGGVAIYSLDNEPTWWESNHRDVHPASFTYDEVTDNGIKVAKAVKAADPTAEVSGPVIDFWPAYFFSMKDIRSGWSSPPNWVYWGNPVDRNAHGGVPLLEYYLQQFKAAQEADPNQTRFLDYLDLHTYFVANNAGFNPAGTADQQQAVINSTRVFWDSTYNDPNLADPDTPGKAPMVIRRMQDMIARNYPGTKTAITEYNWGGQEHISGAVAQADILGIFGREGLDVGTLWGVPDPSTQKPGIMAFRIFRNYDGANGEFGDMGLTATSADQGKLSVYAAMRTKDGVLTVVVINKTFGDLKADLPLANFTAGGAAKVYQYSSADLNNIKQLSDITVPQPPSGSTTSTIQGVTFPAMSITVIAVLKG